jgi:hypothetical protein
MMKGGVSLSSRFEIMILVRKKGQFWFLKIELNKKNSARDNGLRPLSLAICVISHALMFYITKGPLDIKEKQFIDEDLWIC